MGKITKTQLCQCGCGELCYNRFKRGHSSKTKEFKEYIKRISKGRVFTEEHKTNIRNAIKGQKWSEERKNNRKRGFAEGKYKLSPMCFSHPSWSKGLTKETDERLMKISIKSKGKKQPSTRGENNPAKRPEVRELIRLSKLGNKNSAWNNGSSFEPYSSEFNEILKEQIRKRDNYRCQQCFRHQDELRTKDNKKYKLIIHHIDYNKKNNEPSNLISLCNNCHSQTNFKRDEWIEYFQNKVIMVN